MGNASEYAKNSGIFGNFAVKLASFEKNMGIVGKKCTQNFALYIVFVLVSSAKFVEKAWNFLEFFTLLARGCSTWGVKIPSWGIASHEFPS